MKTKEFFCQGTLGDTYIFTLKLMKIKADKIKVYHKTLHKNWYNKIKEIYSLCPNIEVEFVDDIREDLVEITSNCHKQSIEFFPKFNIKSMFKIQKPYFVIQPHSGKDNGGNTKKIPRYIVKDLIHNLKFRTILLGTDKDNYGTLGDCYNFVGRTTIKDSISLIKNSSGFIGSEGFLSFVALSQKVRSIIWYTSYEAVSRRIIETRWGEYCNLLIEMPHIKWR